MKNRELIRALFAFVLFLLLVPVLLFFAAGTMDWPMAWIFTALYIASALVSRLIVWRKNPDTLRERARYSRSEGVRPWDRALVLVVGILGPILIVLVAGLDHRLGWSTLVPLAGQILAAIVVAAGYGLGVWAMVVNRFFSAVARLQPDRGQVVVKAGPYRLVRHPAYAGSLVASLALPFMLDAVWALIPALGLAVALAIRTHLEDRLLRQGLPGYAEYAQQTPSRLIPGLW